MTLYDFIATTECDYDTLDEVYDESVTISVNLEPEDDYDEFCIALIKKIEVKDITDSGDPICDWSDYIKRNSTRLRGFANDYWYKNNFEDEDDFICEWIKEFHLLLAGYGEDGCYDYLKEELVDKCE